MKYSIQFKDKGRIAHADNFTLRDFCVQLVDSYSLTEDELEQVCRLEVGGSFENEDMLVKRIS